LKLTAEMKRALAHLDRHGYAGRGEGFRLTTFRALEREGLCRLRVTTVARRRYYDHFHNRWATAAGYRDWLAEKVEEGE
jgi:hypothetical protein